MDIQTVLLTEFLPMMLATAMGVVGIAAFLKLATFSERDIWRVSVPWAGIGSVALVVHLMLVLISVNHRDIILFMFALLLSLGLSLYLRAFEPSNKYYRWQASVLAWVYIWSVIILGGRRGWLGPFTITLPALLFLGLGLFFVAGFLLPFPSQPINRRGRPLPEQKGIPVPTFLQEKRDLQDLLRYPENRSLLDERIAHHRQALRCLITFTLGTNYSYHVIIDEKIAERTQDMRTWLTEKDKQIQRVEGDSFGEFLSGPGIILTGCDHAIAISTGLKFKGVKGPGVIFTEMSDSIQQVIDLRVQLRAFPVEAWTRDGIRIKVVVFVPFQIGTGREAPALGKSFPYRASDAFKAVHAQVMRHVDDSQAPASLETAAWYDLPAIVAKRIIREVISHYDFDELYTPFELPTEYTRDPRAEIIKALRDGLDAALPEWGIQRVGGGISNLLPADPRVLEQRIEAWKVEWSRQMMLQQAAGQTERLSIVERARAQARIDLILSIGERVERLRSDGSPVPADRVVRHFIDVLQDLAQQPTMRRYLRGDTGDILNRAMGTLGGDAGDPERE